MIITINCMIFNKKRVQVVELVMLDCCRICVSQKRTPGKRRVAPAGLYLPWSTSIITRPAALNEEGEIPRCKSPSILIRKSVRAAFSANWRAHTTTKACSTLQSRESRFLNLRMRGVLSPTHALSVTKLGVCRRARWMLFPWMPRPVPR